MNQSILLRTIVSVFFLLTFSQGIGQTAASATWALTANGNATVSGSVSASAITKGSSNGNLSYSSAGVSCNGWPNGGSLSATAYYEYAVTPTAGQDFRFTSLSFTHSSSSSTLTGAIYYSLDNFSSATQLGGTFSSSTSSANASRTTDVTVPSGATLRVRIYAWHGGLFATRNLRNRNVVITGQTCAPAAVVTSPASAVLCQGESLNLTGAITGVSGYQWYRNGVAISGATAATYTKNNVTIADSGWYVLLGTYACGSVATQGASVSVSPAPVVTASASLTSVCEGQPTTLSAVATMPSGVASGTNQTDFAIPDNDLVNGIQSTISIPETCASAADIVQVQIAITHTYNADLQIFLMGPNSDYILLMQNKGGSANGVNMTLVPSGTAIPSTNTVLNGTYIPDEPFTNLSGNASGNWTLFVFDGGAADTGSLTGWSMSLNNANCGTVTYSWTPADSLSNASAANPVANPTEPTTYTVTATANGCQSTAQVFVDITPAPQAGYIDGSLDSCGANSGTLNLLDYVGTIVRWESSTDDFVTPVNIVNTTSTYAVTGLTQTTAYRALVQSGSCTAYSQVFYLEPGSTTTWTDSGWSNGVPSSTTAVIFSADYAEEDNLRACSVTVTNDANVIIRSGYSMEIGSSLDIESGTFTVENNANLIQLDETVNQDPITVYRNSSALMRQDYTLWSSPVEGQGMLAFSPLTVISPTVRFYNYNTTTNLYNSVPSISTAQFNKGAGYLIRMPNNHPSTPTVWEGVFNGVPHNGDVPLVMNNVGVGQAFNLVGNPYPSPIDMYAFIEDNTDAITGTLYFWRKTNNIASPSYCQWTLGTFVSNGEDQVFDPEGVIRTGQGFFVEAKPGQTNLIFKNSQRFDDNANQFFRAPQPQKDRLWLNLTGSTAGSFSQAAIVYTADATLEADKFDGRYINDGPIRLTTKIAQTEYSINGRPAFDATDVVPMSYTVANAGTYTLAMSQADGVFAQEQDVFLRDNLLGVVHPIKTSAYTFATEAGSFDGRFDIIYQNALTTPDYAQEAQAVVYKSGQDFVVDAGNQTLLNVEAFDLQGRLIAKAMRVNASTVTLNCGTANQVIVFKISTVDGRTAIRKAAN